MKLFPFAIHKAWSTAAQRPVVNSCACGAGCSVHGDMQFVYSMQSTSEVTCNESGKSRGHGGPHNKARLVRCEQGIEFEELLGVSEVVSKHDD